MFSEYTHMTAAESERRQLAIEIAHYENLIEKATQSEAKDAFEAERNYLTLAVSSGSFDHPSPVKQSMFDTSKLCEIATLQWPMIFGEACVVDPEGGLSRGTIVADTTTDVFVIHKKQLQTFYMDVAVVDKVKQKAVTYPDDTELVAKNRSKDGWLKIRETMLADIPKGRWPARQGEAEPFVF
jgi:hypothetical protein